LHKSLHFQQVRQLQQPVQARQQPIRRQPCFTGYSLAQSLWRPRSKEPESSSSITNAEEFVAPDTAAVVVTPSGKPVVCHGHQLCSLYLLYYLLVFSSL
jgi:hypothetical protein